MARLSIAMLWRVLTGAWGLGEITLALVTYTRRGRGNVQDRGTQLLIWVVIISAGWIAGKLRETHPMPMPFPEQPWRAAMLALLLAGMLVRVTAIFTLGRAFSANVAIRSGQSIQRHGLYRIVRHPSYLGLEIILLAAALHAHDWLFFGIFFIPSTLAILFRIHVEETALLRAFGSDYEQYMHSTKRLIPGVF
jgi:protein-S-isoprenylcysteine O-methyltransferase Ste14